MELRIEMFVLWDGSYRSFAMANINGAEFYSETITPIKQYQASINTGSIERLSGFIKWRLIQEVSTKIMHELLKNTGDVQCR